MSRVAPLVLASLAMTLVACAKSETRTDSAAGTAGATTAAAPATPATTVSLAQIEGTWQGKSMSETSDSALSTWTLDAPSDTTKWITTFSNGLKVPVHIVAVAGDSVVSQMGPYKSPSRKGEMVNARIVTRLQGEKIVGTFETRPVAKPDSVTRGRLEGTRK